MKMSELREKDIGSLQALETELQENLFAARLQKRSGQLENTAKIALTKRDLAQVKTVLRARELGLEVIETPSADASKKSEKKAASTPATKPAAAKGKAKSKAKAKAPKGKKSAPAKAAKPAAKKTTTKAAAKPAGKKAEKKTAGKKK